MAKVKRFTKSAVLTFLIISIWISVSLNIAAEQETTEMYSMVAVNPSFRLSLDKEYLEFGHVEPGQTVELKSTGYYNQLKCVSNKGIRWYLEISLPGGVIGPEGSEVGPEAFKWMIISSSGDGIYDKKWHPFSNEPSIAYTAGSRDTTGEEVVIRLRYKVDLPHKATAGDYTIRVLYTMTETER